MDIKQSSSNISSNEEYSGNEILLEYGKKIKRLFGLNFRTEIKVEELPFLIRYRIAQYFESFLMILSIVPEIDFCYETRYLFQRSLPYDFFVGISKFYPISIRKKVDSIYSKMSQENILVVLDRTPRLACPPFYIFNSGTIRNPKFDKDTNPLWLRNQCLRDSKLRVAIDRALTGEPYDSLILDIFKDQFLPQFKKRRLLRKRSFDELSEENEEKSYETSLSIKTDQFHN